MWLQARVWDTSESMTSSGQVLCAVVVVESGLGAFGLLDCQLRPVEPVLDPQDCFSPQMAGDDGKVESKNAG